MALSDAVSVCNTVVIERIAWTVLVLVSLVPRLLPRECDGRNLGTRLVSVSSGKETRATPALTHSY